MPAVIHPARTAQTTATDNRPADAAGREQRRREQFRQASAKVREARKAAGAIEIRLVLTGDDAATFTRLQEAQRGPVADFPRRALMCGAKFLANSGHPAGRKPGKSQS